MQRRTERRTEEINERKVDKEVKERRRLERQQGTERNMKSKQREWVVRKKVLYLAAE